ncbi:MAG: hypothetical protein ACXVRD_03525 [Gaiellaceae bacterium]
MAADRKLLAATFAAIAFLTAGPARAALSPPSAVAPAAGVTVEFLPAFVWTPVKSADHYEFQISADPGMGSPVLGGGKDDFSTHNTRATLIQTVPNGTYYWRVRAIGADGSISAWTPTRAFTKLWNLKPSIQSPAAGASLTFPSNPVVLSWSGIPGAAQYLVPVASDPLLGSIVFRYSNQDDPNGPPNVAATSAGIASPLAPGSYYWAVQPVDAEGNRGAQTPVTTFSWVWPSATTPQVTDLNPAPEVFDPELSWTPVPGAARYEVEVNSSVSFSAGSKVCCTGTTIGTSLSPPSVLKDNTYYWRVRALDPEGNAGLWNVGQSFTQAFDKGPPSGPVPGTSIKNVHMRDNVTDDPVAADADHDLSDGYSTRVPVVAWDPVPGASSYEVQIADWNGTDGCLWATASYLKKTSVPEWAPLGHAFANPVIWQGTLAQDTFDELSPSTYCFRVRARADRATGNQEVWGDYTYLQNGQIDSNTPAGPSFTWSDYPDPSDSSDSHGCNVSYLCGGDYVLPLEGTVDRRTPFFTWKPIFGAESYFVVVSKDQNFSNIVDEGFTRIPAYAPRNSLAPTTYTDETTSYYWEVLPSSAPDGSSAPARDSILGNPQDFQKQSLAPTLVYPAAAQVFSDQPTFRWDPAEGARRYRLQVASDTSFSNLLDDVTTDATSYTSNTTYPADTVLYWRVSAADENLNGLSWSTTGTFQKTLPVPVPSATNPTSGDMLPVWAWAPVQGASSYDVEIDQPDGQHKVFANLFSPLVSFIKMTGTGIWHWRVRAEFPQGGSATTPGPYSALRTFTRTIGQPVNLQTDSGTDHVLLSWDPRIGVKDYRLEISSTPDFSQTVEDVTTDNTSYAPVMMRSGYTAGGTLFWRVAGVDQDHNQGDWSQVQQIKLQPKLKVSVIGLLRLRRSGRVSVSVADGRGQHLGKVLVRISGKGIKTRSARTNAQGRVTFTLKPKKRGKLLVTASLAGYQTAYGTVKVN